MNQTTLEKETESKRKKKKNLAPPTESCTCVLFLFASLIISVSNCKGNRAKSSRVPVPNNTKSKQCETEPLSLLYDFFIGKFTILNDIKNLSLLRSFADYCFFEAGALLKQRPILILFVNNKIPNFSPIQLRNRDGTKRS